MIKVFAVQVLQNKYLYLNKVDDAYKNLMAPILMNPAPEENSSTNPMLPPKLGEGI